MGRLVLVATGQALIIGGFGFGFFFGLLALVATGQAGIFGGFGFVLFFLGLLVLVALIFGGFGFGCHWTWWL